MTGAPDHRLRRQDEEDAVQPNQTPQQTPPQQTPPQPPTEACPDPNPPFTRYRVRTAVAQERARLYAADTTLVIQRYDRLAGAQSRFATAKTAQSAKFDDLRQRVERIAAALDRDLDHAERDHLKSCWDRLNKETAPPATTTDCTEVDNLDCDHLPDDAARLQQLEAQATACTSLADAEF